MSSHALYLFSDLNVEQTSKLIRWVQMETCDAEVAELHHAMNTVSPKYFEVIDIWLWRTMLV